ncbi:MAG: hypothetical protein CMH11_03860 [Maritimibacter sp.]|nr:hypothetical protein [Maritimibacter sp.]
MIRGILVACCLPGLAVAQAYDGIYRPAGMDWWDCTSIGMDGGAVAIGGGELQGVENACTLSDPVDVRAMSATLYDMECMGEGMSSTERVMLMTSDAGVYVIRDGFVAEWERCE